MAVSDEERVRDVIVGKLAWSGDRSELTDDYPLIENHVLDSLGMIQLVSLLETEFGIPVADEDLVPGNFQSVGAIAAFIASKRS